MTRFSAGLIELLAEDSASFKGAAVDGIIRSHWPPEITLINRFSANLMCCASLLEPALGNNATPIDYSI